MSDDDTPDASGADARDERLAQALAVPPLDDVTRRRLVRTALEHEPEEPRSPARFAAIASIAAALVVGAVIGWALVRQPDETSTTTARRGSQSGTGTVALAPSSSNAAVLPAAGDSTGPVTALGDLGDVTDANRLRTQLQESFVKSAGPEDPSAVAQVPCVGIAPRSVDLVAVSAIGTATYKGMPATVLVGTSPEGHALAVIVRPPDCTLAASVPLPTR